MIAYLRLLKFLKPYRARLAAALACMVVYALMSGVSLGLVAPFMKVLFEPHLAATAAGASNDPAPGSPAATRVAVSTAADAGSDRLIGWPDPLRRLASRWLLRARPIVALERLCVFILVVLLHYSTVISELSERNTTLAQRLALLEKRLEDETLERDPQG